MAFRIGEGHGIWNHYLSEAKRSRTLNHFHMIKISNILTIAFIVFMILMFGPCAIVPLGIMLFIGLWGQAK